jgi:hypothetical protein
VDSKIERQILTDSSGNEVYAKDYTWRDHKTNEEIINELKVNSILEKKYKL